MAKASLKAAPQGEACSPTIDQSHQAGHGGQRDRLEYHNNNTSPCLENYL